MNLNHSIRSNSFSVLLGLIVIISILSFYHYLDYRKDTIVTSKGSQTLKELEYEELSPDGLNKIISYHVMFNFGMYRDFLKEYVDNDTIISVRDMEDDTENYIFTGGRIGEPKWLGNEHVFFTSYCGSSCQGIYLVNVFNKETEQGTLSYMFSEQSKTSYTVFQDWFGHTFKFDGLVNEIRSDTIGNKTYLIFYMRDDEQKSIGQKKFLFTGKTLEE